jgi:hypothetical protein
MTSTALVQALTMPHAGMTVFTLSARQRENVLAYILSLR